MSALVLLPPQAAMAINLTKSFVGSGGTPPYTYSVIAPPAPATPAGGTVNPATGYYTSPAQTGQDVILVTDALAATAQSLVTVGTPLELFCDILRQQMGLDSDHIYLWDQTLLQPKDSGLYIAVSVSNVKPFGSANVQDGSGPGIESRQSVNVLATLSVDIISRGPDARDRKEEIIMALKSNYAEQQMNANSFFIGQLSYNFVNLSHIDGSAIPYRFNIGVNLQYAVSKAFAVDYFSTVQTVAVTTEP